MPEERQFPLLLEYKNRNDKTLRRSIPWSAIAPHEKQAISNHSQTLERLAERGGLSPQEAIWVFRGQRWRGTENIMSDADACAELTRIIDDHLQGWCVIWEEDRVPRLTSNIADEALAKEYAKNILSGDGRRSIVAICDGEKLRQLSR